MRIDQVSGVPAYRQLATDLRDRITAGEYVAGAKLPSERELVEAYQVSRITVREAISLLRTEGLVEPRHGKGLFVREPLSVIRLGADRLRRSNRIHNKSAFLGDAAAGGFRPGSEVTVRTEPASPDHAEVLGVAVGAELLVRERLMTADGLPVQLATSRFARKLTRNSPIEESNPGPGGVHQRLEDAGHVLDHFTETVTTRMPNRDEASALQLSTGGVPVLVIRRVAYDTDGQAVEVNDMTLAGNRYVLGYELPAD